MTTLEAALFLGTPVASLAIGYAVGWWGLRRDWTLTRCQAVASLFCFLGPLTIFFVTEFQAVLGAGKGAWAAAQGGAATAAVLAFAFVPLAPIPAFFGAYLAARIAARGQDEVEKP